MLQKIHRYAVSAISLPRPAAATRSAARYSSTFKITIGEYAKESPQTRTVSGSTGTVAVSVAVKKPECTEEVLKFSDIKEKSHFSLSEKCEISAETERCHSKPLRFISTQLYHISMLALLKYRANASNCSMYSVRICSKISLAVCSL